jgi:hypothetical protein
LTKAWLQAVLEALPLKFRRQWLQQVFAGVLRTAFGRDADSSFTEDDVNLMYRLFPEITVSPQTAVRAVKRDELKVLNWFLKNNVCDLTPVMEAACLSFYGAKAAKMLLQFGVHVPSNIVLGPVSVWSEGASSEYVVQSAMLTAKLPENFDDWRGTLLPEARRHQKQIRLWQQLQGEGLLLHFPKPVADIILEYTGSLSLDELVSCNIFWAVTHVRISALVSLVATFVDFSGDVNIDYFSVFLCLFFYLFF